MTNLNTNVSLYEAAVLADSISPDGVRLTTLVVNMPRFILAEFNTHRVFSRNSASSRAIPVKKRIKLIEDDPFVPIAFGKNQPGMQSSEDLDEMRGRVARLVWLLGSKNAVAIAQELSDLEVHKQFANRVLEPYSPHTVIVTATEWANFYALRIHPHAQPEINRCAESMLAAMEDSQPRYLGYGQWHLPLVDEEGADADLTLEEQIKVCTGRCARVSYLTHGGDRDPSKDVGLHDTLLSHGHMSPPEHPARPMSREDIEKVLLSYSGVTGVDRGDLDPTEHFSGNFRGWVQYRKTLHGEAVFNGGNS